MATDNDIINLYESFYDNFGGSVTFSKIITMCSRRQGTVQIKVRSPWGDSETVYVEWDEPFVKTYSNGIYNYTVDHRLFCGQESTKLDCRTTYLPVPKGTLVCHSTPVDNAQIWIDGSNTGEVTSKTFTDMEVGEYTVLFKKSGYNDCIKTITIIAGQITGATCNLIALKGNILCATFDKDGIEILNAAIAKNSVNTLQKTPFTLTNLDPGKYNIGFEKTEYIGCNVDVTVVAGITATARCTLLLRPTTGSLSVTSDPTGAAIWMGTRDTGKLTGDIPVIFPDLPPAPYPYIIVLKKPGWNSCTIEQDVVAGESRPVHCNLQPGSGTIKCSSTPPGAQIWIGDILGKNLVYKGITGSLESPTQISGVRLGVVTVQFRLTDYDTYQERVFIWAGGIFDVSCTLVPSVVVPKPGFNITVDIPGLVSNSKLYVEEVERIPLTDTWINIPLASGMRWENISNRVYKAKVNAADCDPLTSSHSGFRLNQDYAIYTGTSTLSLYPGKLVHKSIDGIVNVNLIEPYIDWITNKLCSAFDISSDQCSNFILTSVNDVAFLLEEWMIITEHKNLAGEPTLPTALDYALIPIAIFGIFSPGISEGAVAKIIGKRLTDLIKISKTGSVNVKNVLNDHTIDTFLMRASETQFDDFVRFMEAGNDISAKAILDLVEMAPLSVNEVHALQRGSRLIEQIDSNLIQAGSIENTGTVLSKFSPELIKIYHNALEWVKINPSVLIFGASGIGVAAIWYIGKQNSEYIDNIFKAKGVTQSDESWNAKEYINVLESYYYILEDAERLGNWVLFCENMILWQTDINHFETYLTSNQSALEQDGTYEVLTDSLLLYKKSIELKNEVHTCVPVALPESIEAKVTEILDGDTVKIEYEGKEYDVRFLGINTPEGKTYDYTCTGLREPFLVRRLITPGNECIEEETWNVDEDFYNSSKKWLANQLPVSQIATFNSDLTKQFDKYGRLLASPYNNENGSICNNSLRDGQSVVFFYDDNAQVNKTEFLATEKEAKDALKGVWGFNVKRGWIKFISDPTAAEVYLDGINIGKTVSNTLLIETTVGTHTYEFKKIGYDGCKGTILEVNITHTENDPFERTCNLNLQELICPSPNASFITNPSSPKLDEYISFDASGSSGGSGHVINKYSWNFGDGSSGLGKIISHTYTIPGSYVTKLTVRNDCGRSDISQKTIKIDPIIDTGDLTVKTYSAPGVLLTGVVLYLDNVDKGAPPVTIKNIPIGSHSVRLEKTGYLGCAKCEGVACTPGTIISPCDFNIVILKDVISTLEVTMQKMFPVEISSDPAGAEIKIDGELVISISSINLNRVNSKEPNLIERILDGYTPVLESTEQPDTAIFLRKLNDLKK